MKISDLSSWEGKFEAQIRFDEALKGEENELEGAESKLREKKNRKKREREPQEASKKC